MGFPDFSCVCVYIRYSFGHEDVSADNAWCSTVQGKDLKLEMSNNFPYVTNFYLRFRSLSSTCAHQSKLTIRGITTWVSPLILRNSSDRIQSSFPPSVAFQPNASMNTAHHMLLYGCGEPGGGSKPLWNCGEMSKSDSDEDSGSPCEGGSHSQIIYAWARDAPRLNLPDGVGFKVGKNSPIKYLVLQVHYMHSFEEGRTDDSGIFIHYTTEPLRKLAGVLLLGTSGLIPPHRKEAMESACEINEKKVIYPFAYRTHTHSLGKLVSGYRVRSDVNGNDQWTLLGMKLINFSLKSFLNECLF